MSQINPAGRSTSPESMPLNNESFLPQSTVLIVDDNPQNVELLQAFLESLPVKIVTAVDGLDALEKVAQHNPDLILLDIMMPAMDGYQVSGGKIPAVVRQRARRPGAARQGPGGHVPRLLPGVLSAVACRGPGSGACDPRCKRDELAEHGPQVSLV